MLSGQSDRMVLQAYTQKSDQLFETNESALTNMDGFQLTPVFGVLMTVGCSMAIVFLSISGNKWHFFTKIVLTCCEKKNVLVFEKNFWDSRLKAKNLQNNWDHLNNLFKQWKVRTISGNRILF